MSRETEVSLRLTESAKQIYDKLPAKGKGTWVSEAIEEKHNKESNPFTLEQEERILEILRNETRCIERQAKRKDDVK